MKNQFLNLNVVMCSAVIIDDRSPPLYYLPSGPLNPSEERVFVFCYKKL